MYSMRSILPDIRQHSRAMLGIMVLHIVFTLLPIRASGQTIDNWYPIRLEYVYNIVTRAITTDQEGRIFIGTRIAGIFRSTDGGEKWEMTAQGLPFDAPPAAMLASLFCHPNGTLFASIDPYVSNHVPSIYRSTNHGDSWERLITNTPAPILAFAADSSDGIYAGSHHGTILYSSDNGAHWNSTPVGCDTDSVTAIAVRPNGDIYVGTRGLCSGSTLFRSTDKGNHWTPLNFTEKNVRSIKFNSRGDVLVVTREGSLQLSRDQGANWSTLGGSTWHPSIGFLVVTPDDRIITEFNRRVHISSDYGSTWHEPVFPVFNPVHALWRSNNGDLLVALEGNLHRSTDNGTTWQAVCNYPDTASRLIANLDVSAIATHSEISYLVPRAPAVTFHLYMGTRGQGIYTSLNRGLTWRHNINPGIDTISALLVTPDGTVYAGGNGGLFRSSDSGITWPPAVTGFAEMTVTGLTRDTGTAIFAGTGNAGIFRSLDNGITWTPQNTGISDPGIVSLSADSSGRLFAVTAHTLFISEDRGNTWQAKNTSSISPVLRTAVLARYGRIALGTERGVFISSDNGTSWQPSQQGIGEHGINALAATPSGFIIAATDTGVFASTNGGDSWNFFSRRSYHRPPACIDIQRELQTVYIGTRGGGGFSRGMFVSQVENQNIHASAPTFQITASPNPATSLVTFNVDLQRGGQLALDIYNSLGQRIASPVKEHFEPGTYSLPWNSGDCPAGTYFFRFMLGDEIESGRLVIE